MVLAIATAMLILFATECVAQVDDRENAKLESWLAERKLDSLLQKQLESRLESTTNTTSREQIGKRLATLYGKRLLSLEGDPQELLKRTRNLIAIYPRFESGRLRVAMLHARYLESETLFRDWIRSGAVVENGGELESTLRTLDEDLSSALSALTRRSEELFAAGQLSRDRRNLDVERQTVEAEALHCQFLAGWSSYFVAMLSEKNRDVLLGQSDLRFREFLQLDQKTMLLDYDSRWFDFSSAWHVRAIAGLAAIATARDDQALSLHLYKLIESNAMTRDSREAVIRFRFLGNSYCQKFEAATNVVRDRKGIAAMSRAGRIRLWVTVLDTGQSSNSAQLKQFALTGLTRNMAGEILIREYEQAAQGAGAESFESCWTAGYIDFWKSENGEPTAIEKAKQLLQKAVSLGSDSDQTDVARCRYLLAWLMLKQNQTENAIGVFSQVAQQLADSDPRLAGEAEWLAAKASIRLGARSGDAFDRLERFVRTWPDSPHANKASFEKLKIELRSMPARDAIRRLKEIPAGDENHGAAILETAAQHYRVWQSAPEAAGAFERFQSACVEVSSNRSASAGQKLRANFFLADALLRSKPLKDEELSLLFQRCERLLEQVDEPNLARPELLYYQMRFAKSKGDGPALVEAATSAAQLGKGTRFELPALIEIAQHHDSNLVNSNDPEHLSAAIEIYQRLSDRLGNDVEKLRSSGNARVAFARVGELKQTAGKAEETESIFQTLVDNFPGNATYLRHLAIAKSVRDSGAAKAIWQRIASGSEAGTDLWFESKLELAKLIGSSDSNSAINLLKQTMQLGGDMSESWQQAYETTIKQLSPDGDR